MKKLTVAYLSFIFSVFFGYLAALNIPLPIPKADTQTVLVSGLAKNQEPTGTEVTPDIRVALLIAAASTAAKQLEASQSAVQTTPTPIKSGPTINAASTIAPIITPTELPTPTATPLATEPTSVPKSSATVVNDPGSAVVIPQQDSSAQIEGAVVTTN